MRRRHGVISPRCRFLRRGTDRQRPDRSPAWSRHDWRDGQPLSLNFYSSGTIEEAVTLGFDITDPEHPPLTCAVDELEDLEA